MGNFSLMQENQTGREGEMKESEQHRNDKLWDAVESQQSEATKESS